MAFPAVLVIAAAVSFAAAAPVVADEASQYKSYNPSACQKSSFRCGDSVDVRYPFFLANATYAVAKDDTAYAESYCGYPGMAIACDEEGGRRATLKLGRDSYTVLSIDYDNHTVTVASSEEDDDDDGCPRVAHNVTVPAETWLNLSDTANANIIFFYDCVFTDGGITPPPAAAVGIPAINCSSFRNPSGAKSYVVMQPDVRLLDGWARPCRQQVVAPVLRDRLLNHDENYLLRLNNDGYGKLLKLGFQLTWDPSAGSCYLCENSGGQCNYNQVGEFIGCICSDGRVRSPDCGSPSSKMKITAYIGSAVLSAILLSLLFVTCALKKRHGTISCIRGSKHAPSIESFLQKHEAQHPKRYTYSEVKRMTKSFAEKLGQGGFGTVYKGTLPSGRFIAVKLLGNSKDDGQEFINEVASIMRTSHVNVVTLLGYCLEGSKRALIYEYMPNGSLERFASRQNSEGKNLLSWDKLFDITIGIARGLEYLHRGCSTRIVHFDIKPHNILLDQDFYPKISDFGLAKLCVKKESIISIDGARGTIGYIAPEVFSKQFGEVSSKSDVYSFGMVVLEMVGARKNIHESSKASTKYFPQWVYEHLEEYCVNTGEINVHNELIRKLIVVGLWCIQLHPNNRPSMTRVVEMLESQANDLQVPPQSLLC